MEDDNASLTPEAPDSQAASGSGAADEPPGLPPILPELEAVPAAARSSRGERDRARSFAPADWLAVLRNRLILTGLAVVTVLLLIAIVLVAIGSGDGGPVRRTVVDISTPEGEPTALPGRALSGFVRTTTSMRNGPGPTYPVLGTIPKRALVTVVGRNANESWLQVAYPPGSQLRGWVSLAYIDVDGDISRLAIAGPGAAPAVAVPTGAAPDSSLTAEPSEESTATEPSSTLATPAGRPTRTPRPSPTRTPRASPTQRPEATPTLEPTATPPLLPTETPGG